MAAEPLKIDTKLLDELAALSRESASPVSRRAAEMIRERLADCGAEARIEHERVHGTYWVPLGILQGLVMLAAALPRRLSLPLSVAAGVAIADELWIGRRPLRALLRHRQAANVVAVVGPPKAERTVVVHAHHDAAHSGLVFHPAVPRLLSHLPLLRRRKTTTPVLWSAMVGPALVASGSMLGMRRLRLAGVAASASMLAVLLDIARAPVVPGACDNLSGVAALLALAGELAADPPDCRVVLLSTDAEESFLEGMEAFLRRHRSELQPEETTFLCLESVGSGHLVVLDGEGMLRLHRCPARPREALERAAERLGLPVETPFRFRFATDAQLPLLAGYPSAVISSIDWYRTPRNYHWPTDDFANVDLRTTRRAARLALAFLRDRGSAELPVERIAHGDR